MGYSLPVQSPEMTINSFLRFASDFEVTTIMLSRMQLIIAFKRSKFGVPSDPIDSNATTKIRLNFQGRDHGARRAGGPAVRIPFLIG